MTIPKDTFVSILLLYDLVSATSLKSSDKVLRIFAMFE